MEEALAFLSLPRCAAITPAAMEKRPPRRRCLSLHPPKPSRPLVPALRFHRRDDGIHRHLSPPSPAMMAPSTCNAPGLTRPEKANLVRPRKALGRVHGFGGTASGATLLAGEGIEFYRWLPPFPAFMPQRLYRRAASAPSNHPKTSPCWSSPAIKMWKAGTPRTVFNAAVVERSIPSIVIVPEHSDFNDDLIAFGEETLAARIAPLIASTQSAATVEERRGSGRIIT